MFHEEISVEDIRERLIHMCNPNVHTLECIRIDTIR